MPRWHDCTEKMIIIISSWNSSENIIGNARNPASTWSNSFKYSLDIQPSYCFWNSESTPHGIPNHRSSFSVQSSPTVGEDTASLGVVRLVMARFLRHPEIKAREEGRLGRGRARLVIKWFRTFWWTSSTHWQKCCWHQHCLIGEGYTHNPALMPRINDGNMRNVPMWNNSEVRNVQSNND